MASLLLSAQCREQQGEEKPGGGADCVLAPPPPSCQCRAPVLKQAGGDVQTHWSCNSRKEEWEREHSLHHRVQKYPGESHQHNHVLNGKTELHSDFDKQSTAGRRIPKVCTS